MKTSRFNGQRIAFAAAQRFPGFGQIDIRRPSDALSFAGARASLNDRA